MQVMIELVRILRKLLTLHQSLIGLRIATLLIYFHVMNLDECGMNFR
jgi:hypothetical protein